MPTSTSIFKTETINFIKERFSSDINILDIGAGCGSYSDLLRSTFKNLDALEVYEPYVETYNLREKYRHVIIGDVTTTSHDLSQYSLFILGDVFEHIAEQQAKELLDKLASFSNAEIIVAVPFNSPQSELFDNAYERHLQPKLSLYNMLKLYPQLTPLCLRYDYGVFVTKRPENDYLPLFYTNFDTMDPVFLEKLKRAYPYRSIINADMPIETVDVLEIFKEEERNRGITIVTGLWDLTGERGSSYEQYKSKFVELLKAPMNMLIYTSQQDEEFIWAHRSRENTFVKTMEIEEFKTFFQFYGDVEKIRNTVEWNSQSDRLKHSPQATIADYNPIAMSKMFLLNNATVYNPFNSGYFYWIDGDITNTAHRGYFTHDKIVEYLPNYAEANEGFVLLSYSYGDGEEMHGIPRNQMVKYCGLQYSERMCSGKFFGGYKPEINSVNSLYHGVLGTTLFDGYMGTEENVFTILSYKFPEMVSIFNLDDTGSIRSFFETLKFEFCDSLS